jgi:chemotaxis protein CheX
MILEKKVDFAQIVLESARENFETVIFMAIEEVAEPGQSIDGASLMGTITFKQALEGCFSIACSKDCAHAIALNMLGMDPSEELSDEEVCDAMGEVTDMIMGSIRKNLREYIDDLIVSAPMVVSGKTLNHNTDEACKQVVVHLKIEDEYFAQLTMSYCDNVNCQMA